jgi:hypothetical protein
MYLCVTAPLLVSKGFQASSDAAMKEKTVYKMMKKAFGIANL